MGLTSNSSSKWQAVEVLPLLVLLVVVMAGLRSIRQLGCSSSRGECCRASCYAVQKGKKWWLCRPPTVPSNQLLSLPSIGSSSSRSSRSHPPTCPANLFCLSSVLLPLSPSTLLLLLLLLGDFLVTWRH
jgi:hypothetical protein